ncbi:MAG TPA: rhomboid family intramembrane serine protease [Jatrophihabitans sp.]|jgi:membrane associated rhomboid family serine protease|uniref:rhomboid family intramembrane serine protease n=1 Tax=Jatrophihabitans sp. TaxID=1932789 RepID=UPI002EFF615D
MQPTQPPAGPDPYPGFAGCYRHPDRLTGVRCVRCDRPICPDCQRAASVGFQCPDDVKAGAATVRQGRTVLGARVGSQTPYITWALIALNVVIYLLTGLGPGSSLIDNTNTELFQDWELVPNVVGFQRDYLRLVTAAFLHLGPLHLLLNMFALYVIGPPLERVMGWWRFLAVYLLGALGGSVAIMLMGDVRQPVVGASGAIFGLFAAALVLSRVVGFDTRSLVITIGINFIFTFSVPGISKLGHIGGFVLGGLASLALLGWTMNRRGPLTDRLRAIQVASLAGLLVVLMALALWRTEQIRDDLFAELDGLRASSMAVSHTPGHLTRPGSSTGVDEPGENYSGVITAVQ